MTRPAPPAAGRRPLVVLEDVVKIYRKSGTDVEVHALRGVTLTFHQGEYVAICGHSGSGKSTLMNLLGCLDRPTSGALHLKGTLVSSLADEALAAGRNR